jgi:hypothetical protein
MLSNKNNIIEKVIYYNSNYYSIPNNTAYAFRLTNYNNVNADVHVWIEGVKAGIWRIYPNSRIVVDRYLKTGQQFLTQRPFVKTNITGFVKIVFVPEFLPCYTCDDTYEDSTVRPDPTQRSKCFNYTDTVTPYTNNSRKCSISANQYSDPSQFYISDESDYDLKLTSFKRVRQIKHINRDMVTEFFLKIVVDDDHGVYNRKNAIMRVAENTDLFVPPPVLNDHPMRPDIEEQYLSPFNLSNTYLFSNM